MTWSSGGASDPKAARETAWRSYLTRSAAGDQTALSALYDETGQLVYSVILRVLGDVADAEEVAMDVYTQVWKSAATYDGSRGSVTAWLITLARNRAIDRLRSRSMRLQMETHFPETFDFPAAGISPERATE